MSQLNSSEKEKIGSSVMSVNARPFVPRMSPTAAPFVPRSFTTNVAAIEKPATLSASAQEFVPRTYNTMSQNGWLDYEDPVAEVSHILDMLTINADNLEVVVEPLVDIVSRYVHDVTVLAEVVEELFNRMLIEPDLRSCGAKLCKYVTERLDIQATETFEQLLLTKCLNRYGNITSVAADSEGGVTSLASFALLITSIIVNDVGNITSELTPVLKEMMLILLAHGTDEALVCVAHVLTSCGNLFYEHGIDIDDVYSMASTFIQSAVTSKYLQDVLKRALPDSWRTVNLSTRSRASNYGIDLEQNHNNQSVSSDDERDVMNRISRLTCIDDLDTKFEAVDERGALDDGEMDPEIEAAFDQFLRDVDENVISPNVVKLNYIPDSLDGSSIQPQLLAPADNSVPHSYRSSQLLALDTLGGPSMATFAYFSNSDAMNPMPYFEGQTAEVSPRFDLSPVGLGLSAASHFFNGQARQFGVNPYVSSPVGATMFPMSVGAGAWPVMGGTQHPSFNVQPSNLCSPGEQEETQDLGAPGELIPYNDDSYDDRRGVLFYNNPQLMTNGCGPQSWWN